MSWSYDSTLASDRDKVRFGIQDTVSADPLFSDEELDAVLAAEGSVQACLLRCAKALMLKFARLVDVTVGKVSESNSQRYQAYKEIVARFEADSAAYVMPSFGGTSVSANQTLDADTGLVQPGAKRGDTDETGHGNAFGGGGQ